MLRAAAIVILFWAVMARAQRIIEIPPPPVDLGVANVRLEMYGWEQADRRFTPAPGLACGDGSMRDELLSGRYQMALQGRWPAGSREVFGFVGGPYPNESRFEVARFTRSGSGIDIILRRYDTGGKGDGYRSWKVIYVSAVLPELPEGRYSAQCAVHDASDKPDALSRATAQCDVVVPNPIERAAAESRAKLKDLADEQLLRSWVDAARAMGDSPLSPREVPVPDVPAYERNDVSYRRLCEHRDEIVRRGAAMVPWLMAALERQAPHAVNRGEKYPPGLARSLMEMMVEIGDPRPAALLVDVVEGLEGRASLPVRRCALDSAEQLTAITFRRHDLGDGRAAWAVEDARAVAYAEDPKAMSQQATALRAWLSREGRDPKRWKADALARARGALSGRDLRAVFAAIEYLQGEEERDDQPRATMDRIGEILAGSRQVGFRAGGYDYQFEGRLLPMSIERGGAMLAYYGPRARGHAGALIRIDRETAAASPERIGQLGRIGGEEVMAYLVERLPELEERLAAADVDARVATPDSLAEQRLRQLLLSQRAARAMIERWAGRTFESTDEVLSWWERNAGRSQGMWLRDGVAITAARADAGDARSQQLIRLLLPECAPAGRADWYRARAEGLGYEPLLGGFLLER